MKYLNLSGLLLLVFSALHLTNGRPPAEPGVIAQVVVIDVSEDRTYHLNGEEMSISELSITLQNAGLHAMTYAVIQIAPDTPMGLYSDFLHELRGMNVSGISYESLDDEEGVSFYKL